MNLRGPKAKISRRLGIAVTQKVQKILDRRSYAPGQHGPTARSQEPKSVFGKQLREKQRLRAQYNISERQLRNYFRRAQRASESTGQALLRLLEARLDAVIYRSGLARSIFAARQYAAHGHFLVNGRRVHVPSIHVRPGDVITLREPSRTCATFLDERLVHEVPPDYLEVDREQFTTRLLRPPLATEVPVHQCNLPMVVEFYSR